VAPQAPVEFGETTGALQEALDVSATAGKKALK
jgi:hypothetical protein